MGTDDKMQEAEGKMKQAAGDATDDEELQTEGKKDEAEGKAKGMVDEATDKVKDVLNKD